MELNAYVNPEEWMYAYYRTTESRSELAAMTGEAITEVCIIVGDDVDIRCAVGSYKGGKPTIRLNRVGTIGKSNLPFVRSLGSIKSAEEYDGIVAAAPAAKAALAKALKAYNTK